MVIGAEGTRRGTPCEEIDTRGAGSWSPDGKWIVVAGNSSLGRGLFKVDIENGSIKRIAEGAAFNPAWSPTEDLIIYSGPQDGPFMPLLAVTSDGMKRKLPEEIGLLRYGERYRFLSDGSVILMKKEVNKLAGDFWMLDLESGKPRRLTQLEGNDEMRDFDITPDGKHIVFDRLSKNSDIVLIEIDPED